MTISYLFHGEPTSVSHYGAVVKAGALPSLRTSPAEETSANGN
jgi:hypothetical protein